MNYAPDQRHGTGASYGAPQSAQQNPPMQTSPMQTPSMHAPQQASGSRPPVTYGQAVKLFYKNYACFNGRANRGEFWYALLHRLIVVGILGLLMMVCGIGMSIGADKRCNASGACTVVAWQPLGVISMVGLIAAAVALTIYALATLIPDLAVTARRLHDTGRSALWLLLTFVQPLGLILLVLMAGGSSPKGEQYDQQQPQPKGIADLKK